jgi:hypothetical protein
LPTAIPYEQIGVLDASLILQPDFYQGPNFKVRNPVPISFGTNHFTIDSDFGVFEADGNAVLMRRVAEINAIANLTAVSQSREFTDAAKAELSMITESTRSGCSIAKFIAAGLPAGPPALNALT